MKSTLMSASLRRVCMAELARMKWMDSSADVLRDSTTTCALRQLMNATARLVPMVAPALMALTGLHSASVPLHSVPFHRAAGLKHPCRLKLSK